MIPLQRKFLSEIGNLGGPCLSSTISRGSKRLTSWVMIFRSSVSGLPWKVRLTSWVMIFRSSVSGLPWKVSTFHGRKAAMQKSGCNPMSRVQSDRHPKWMIGNLDMTKSAMFLKGNTLIVSNRAIAIVMFLSSQTLEPFRDHTPTMARPTPHLRRVQTRRWAQRPCSKAYHTGRDPHKWRTDLVTYHRSSSTNKMINPISENVSL